MTYSAAWDHERHKKYMNDYYAGNRDRLKDQSNKYYSNNKDRRKQKRNEIKREVIEHYGGRCACCGEDNLVFLTIDHIDGHGNDHRRNIAGHKSIGFQMYRWLIKNGFPGGFQVLCWNCNLGKHLNGGVCPHRKEAQ